MRSYASRPVRGTLGPEALAGIVWCAIKAPAAPASEACCAIGTHESLPMALKTDFSQSAPPRCPTMAVSRGSQQYLPLKCKLLHCIGLSLRNILLTYIVPLTDWVRKAKLMLSLVNATYQNNITYQHCVTRSRSASPETSNDNEEFSRFFLGALWRLHYAAR